MPEIEVELRSERRGGVTLGDGMLEGNGDSEHSKSGAVMNLELVDARRIRDRLAPSERRAMVARQP